MRVKPDVCDNVSWRMQESMTSFWFDRWLASGPLCLRASTIANPLHQIKDYYDNSGWDLEFWRSWWAMRFWGDIISSVSTKMEGEDVLIWKFPATGVRGQGISSRIIRCKLGGNPSAPRTPTGPWAHKRFWAIWPIMAQKLLKWV